jgi:hypothetical protein
MRKILPYLLGSVCALAAIGCGGSAETIVGAEQNPRVRALNLVANPSPVDITFDGSSISDNATFGVFSEYDVYRNGNREVRALDADTNGELAAETSLFELSNYYTVVVYPDGEDFSIAQLADDRSVDDDRGQLRIVHLANGAPNVDVFVTAPDTDITGRTPTVSNVAFGTVSGEAVGYQSLTPGQHRIRVTLAGTTTVVPGLDTTITLAEGDSRTLYISNNGTANVFVNADDQD